MFSFRLKTILGIAAIETVLLAVLIIGSLEFLRGTSIEALHHRAESTARILAATAKDAVIANDLATLESFTKELGAHPGVVYVRVLDDAGIVLARRGAAPEGTPEGGRGDLEEMVKHGVFDIQAEVREAGADFGRVEIGFSTAEIAGIMVEAREWFTSIGALEILLTTLFSLLLGLYLTRRLTALTAASERVAGGELGHQIAVAGNDEIGQTINAFNRMSLSLKSFYDQLHESRERLAGEHEQLQSLMDNVADAILTTDGHGRVLNCNLAAQRLFERPAEEVTGQPLGRLIPGLERPFQELLPLVGQGAREQEFEGDDGRGRQLFLELSVSRFHGEEGTLLYSVVLRDTSRRRQAEEAMRLARKVFESSGEAIIVTDAEARVVDVNPAYEAVTGYRREEILGQNPNKSNSGRHDAEFYREMWRSINERGWWSGEIWDRRKNGELFPKWLTINAITGASGRVSHYVGVFSDITEKKRNEERLRKLALYDTLTGLPNRILFRDRLAQALSAGSRHGNATALMFIDLDRFKQVNDTLGHEMGDELLRQVAERIQGPLRHSDTIARLGGDEFTAILPECGREGDVGRIAGEIVDQLERPFLLNGNEARIGASIGIALHPRDGEEPEELLHHADSAMYQAKQAGRGVYRFFSATVEAGIATLPEMEANGRHERLGPELERAVAGA